MEIPISVASKLKEIQQQLKLAIQAHQIMRIKHKGDPDSYKLSMDLRDVEKHIISLGEKQNCVMKWLRNELKKGPANSTLLAKTVTASRGFGGHCKSSCVSASKKCLPPPSMKRNSDSKAIPPLPNKGHCYNNKFQSSSVPKKRIQDGGISYKDGQKLLLNGSDKQSPGNSLIAFNNMKRPKGSESQSALKVEESTHYMESYLAEKVKFLSAVGLVTREVLSELQNRRVERKRRSTANHTQFVYGNSWEITSKKRKKSNYLATNMKHVTRQTARAQPIDTENSFISPEAEKTPGSILETGVSVPVGEKVPQSTNPPVIVPLQNSIPSGQPVAKCNDSCSSDQHRIPSLPAALTTECIPAETCSSCQKTGTTEVCSSCSVNSHLNSREEITKCLSCGVKMATIEGCRAEKGRVLEENSRLNAEKEELEIRATELSVTLAVSEYVAPHQNAYVLVG